VSIEPPFGYLEQREAEYLNLAEVEPTYRSLLVTIRLRVSGVSGMCHDTRPVIAAWAGVSERLVTAGLKRLGALGIVEHKRHLAHGGSRGQTYFWTTAPRPYVEWSPAPLIHWLVAVPAYVVTFYRHQRAVGAPSWAVEPSDINAQEVHPDDCLSAQTARHQGARTEASGRTPTEHHPEANPKVFPNRGAAAPLPTNEEGFAKAVVTLWRAARKKPGLERFTDQMAIKNMKSAAARAWVQGCTLEDMARAIAVHADNPKACPWYVDEWAREARAQREEREASERRMRERERELQEEAARAEAEWAARERATGMSRKDLVRALRP
jgi:hypothetical protein